MSWGSGSTLMEAIIHGVYPSNPDAVARQELYTTLIEAFEDMDWDTQRECLGIDPAFDAALVAAHPSWFEDGSP